MQRTSFDVNSIAVGNLLIKKLTWMLVNVVVSPLPDIMKNQETPENFLDPLCLV